MRQRNLPMQQRPVWRWNNFLSRSVTMIFLCIHVYSSRNLICYNISLPPPESCTCMATGDPHYRTFDGQMIHFMGECKYTLSKFDSTDNCAFNVEVKNVKRHENARVSFTRLVDVKVPGFNIRLLQKRRLTVKLIPIKAKTLG